MHAEQFRTKVDVGVCLYASLALYRRCDAVMAVILVFLLIVSEFVDVLELFFMCRDGIVNCCCAVYTGDGVDTERRNAIALMMSRDGVITFSTLGLSLSALY